MLGYLSNYNSINLQATLRSTIYFHDSDFMHSDERNGSFRNQGSLGHKFTQF